MLHGTRPAPVKRGRTVGGERPRPGPAGRRAGPPAGPPHHAAWPPRAAAPLAREGGAAGGASAGSRPRLTSGARGAARKSPRGAPEASPEAEAVGERAAESQRERAVRAPRGSPSWRLSSSQSMAPLMHVERRAELVVGTARLLRGRWPRRATSSTDGRPRDVRTGAQRTPAPR